MDIVAFFGLRLHCCVFGARIRGQELGKAEALWVYVFLIKAWIQYEIMEEVGMALRKKGERNLKIAEILDSQEFLEISHLPKEHLCSAIINRLYYGVYLIAKSKLLEKGACKQGDKIPHSGKNCIWEKLRSKSCFNEIGLANIKKFKKLCGLSRG